MGTGSRPYLVVPISRCGSISSKAQRITACQVSLSFGRNPSRIGLAARNRSANLLSIGTDRELAAPIVADQSITETPLGFLGCFTGPRLFPGAQESLPPRRCGVVLHGRARAASRRIPAAYCAAAGVKANLTGFAGTPQLSLYL